MKKHWTPRYIKNRIKNYFFEKNNQDLPWLTPDSIILINDLLISTDVGLEFGSGRSTTWFAKRCKFLTSVEDDLKWHEIVVEKLKKQKIDNVNYLYKSSESDTPFDSDYYKVIEEFEDNSLDFVLIDGKHRGILALTALHKVKIGGLIIIDNINRYLPYQTYSPHSINNDLEKMEKEWTLFNIELHLLREIWTSNGVTDTAIFIKTTQHKR